TSGGYPKSSLTLGTSLSTSSNRSAFPACLSCETRLDNIPPGTWYLSVLTSTPMTFISSRPDLTYFSLTGLKYSAISLSLPRSRPVSYSVPLSVATRGSVGGWDVPSANGDIAQSTTSTPASMALR